MRTVLFEVSPRLNGIPQTIRMSGLNSGSGTTQLDGKAWMSVITARPTRSASWAQNGELTASQQSWGTITFYLSEAFGNYVWSTYEWDGAQGRMWVGEDGQDFSTYVQVFEGSVGNLAQSGSKATLTLRGPESTLTTPLLSSSYGGTGGPDGDAGMMGKLKPRAFGTCQTVDPVQVNAANLVYQVHGYGPVTAIPAVYEFAQSKGASRGDLPTYEALIAATLAVDEWATCLAQGMFRLGGQPSKKLSADVQASTANDIATIVPQLLAAAGVPASRIGAMGTFAGRRWNLYQTEAASVGDVARDALLQAGGYLLADGRGVWQVADYYAPQAAVTVNADRSSTPLPTAIQMIEANGPVWRVSVGHDRCWSVHSQDDVSLALSIISDAQLAQAAAIQAAEERADLAVAQAALANQQIAAIVSDGILDRSEKAGEILRYQAAVAERDGLLNQGTTYVVTAERTIFANALQALTAYLNGLSPSFFDTSQDTPVDRAAYKGVWQAYYDARSALNIALTGHAGTISTWAGVSGPGRPADNATVGAPAGTQVAGVDAGTLVAQANTATANIKVINDQIAANAAQYAIDKAKVDATLDADRTTLTAATSKAQGQADQARADIATEVARAQASEDAITTTVTSLTTTVGANTSTIAQNYTTLANADQALSDRVDRIVASSGDAGAAVDREASARAAGDDALSRDIATVRATANDNKAAIQTEQTTRADQFGALTSSITSLTSSTNANAAAIQSNYQTLTNADGALAQQLATVRSAADGNAATISQNYTTLSNADAALSSRIDQASSQVGKNAADISTEQTARASADDSITGRINTLDSGYQGQFSAANTRITQEAQASANRDQSLSDRTSSLESSFQLGTDTPLFARLRTLESTSASATQAQATRTATLEAAVGGALNLNAYFTREYAGGAPYGYGPWPDASANPSLTPSSRPARPGGHPINMHRAANVNEVGFGQGIDNVPAGWYVLECDVEKFGGNWQGAGMHINFNNGDAYNISFAFNPDINDFQYAGPDYNRRSWSVLVSSRSQSSPSFYAMGAWESFGTDGSVSDFVWHKHLLRPATQGEVAGKRAQEGIGPLTSRVTTSESAISNLNGKTTAYWTTTAVAGNNRAQLAIHADANSGGGVDVVGDFRVAGGSLGIANRGLAVQDFNFQAHPGSNTITWSGGVIGYVGRDGNGKVVSVNGGSAQFTNSYVYLYWMEGATDLGVGNGIGAGMGDDRVLMAVYRGGGAVDVTYGGTILDGSRITTGSMDAGVITAGTITTDRLVDNSVTKYVALTNGNTFRGDGSDGGYTAPGGGQSGGGGGGGYCPEDSTPVLLANEERDGPGRWIAAGQLRVGDWVWTQHEQTMTWGAFEVIHAQPFDALLWSARRFHRATAAHLIHLDGEWVVMGAIGQPSGRGVAVHITVRDAHTFVTKDREGGQVLNHNKQVEG